MSTELNTTVSRPREAVISVRQASKCYHVYSHPQDRLKQSLSFGKRKYFKESWALRDVTFEVGQGESIGIVGRNGCGKSTLLQIIAQTTRPTTGSVSVRGRVAALLELGSGFNPEFSGRDNVYMNATILGLSQRQIDERFDTIAAFADIGDCLDRPTKTYSSGMVLRLAFAVQLQVEPDVLIIDEALAVGDEAFQRKCFARLRAFQEQGGTLLFVSHDAHAVIELCDRAVLLDRGEMIFAGRPKDVVEGYHRLLYAPRESQDEIRAQIIRRSQTVYEPSSPINDDLSAAHINLPIESQTSHDDASSVSPALSIGSAGPIAAANSLAGNSWFNPDMKPATTIVYDSAGAEIFDPHLTTLAGERVNMLEPEEEFLYKYRVCFSRRSYQVRFANAMKSKLDALVTSVSIPYGGIAIVEAGTEMDVVFRFRCLMIPEVYFLNAGVVGMVDGREVYLHRIVDAVMIRVNDRVGRTAIGCVDLYTDASFNFTERVTRSAAGIAAA